MKIWIEEFEAGRLSRFSIDAFFPIDSMIQSPFPRKVSRWTLFSCSFLKKSCAWVRTMLSQPACDMIVFEANIFTDM